MTHDDFTKLYMQTLEREAELLISKGAEYERSADRLQNFKEMGVFKKETAERALWGMVSKHILALRDMLYDIDKDKTYTTAQYQEKTSDIRIFMALLEGLLAERVGHSV